MDNSKYRMIWALYQRILLDIIEVLTEVYDRLQCRGQVLSDTCHIDVSFTGRCIHLPPRHTDILGPLMGGSHVTC